MGFEGQAFVIESAEVHERGLQVVNVDRVFGSMESKFVTAAIDAAFLYPAPGEPDGECPRMMAAAVGFRIGDVALHEGRAPELATPDDQRVI